MRNFVTRSWAILALTLSILFVGCGRHGSPTGPSNDQPAIVILHANVGSTGALNKTSTITLNKLVVKLTSSAGDIINDTVVSPTLDSISTASQVINLSYSLSPLRTWKMVTTIIDKQDIVIHKDSATTPQLNPADTVVVNLSLTSKYSMYEARFLNIPDSISSSSGGTGKAVLQITQLKFILDSGTVSEVIVDSISPSHFTELLTHTLVYDYVTPGSHTIKLFAYGPMNSFNGLLYYASSTANSTAGVDATVSVNMAWVGPTTGTGSLNVTVGKVGKIIVNGSLPGTVIP